MTPYIETSESIDCIFLEKITAGATSETAECISLEYSMLIRMYCTPKEW